jgi:N-carbamoylputrescine amidase
MAMAGADFLVYPTAIGWKKEEPTDEHQRQLDAWMTIQRAHAVANGIPAFSINRTCFEPPLSPERFGLTFWGNSFAAGCQGEILAQASAEKEEVLIVTIDKDHSDRVRRAWPFFRDRRIDLYGDLTKRFRD